MEELQYQKNKHNKTILIMEKILTELNLKLQNNDAEEILAYFLGNFRNKIALASSLSLEDQVLTDMILKIDHEAKIFTIDTGMLPFETYKLIDETRLFYNYKLEIYFPKHTNVQEMVNEKGVNLFYESVENRKLCCYNRKVEPLKRAFNGLDAWICGLRKEQSITRRNLNIVEYDEGDKLYKVNPILDWTEEMLWDYVKGNNVPYNNLYKKNYLSIGCEPCTRAVKPGDDIRSGRWWWENPETKECGLHLKREE